MSRQPRMVDAEAHVGSFPESAQRYVKPAQTDHVPRVDLGTSRRSVSCAFQLYRGYDGRITRGAVAGDAGDKCVRFLFAVDAGARGDDIEANDESHFPPAANYAGQLQLPACRNPIMRISGGAARGIPLIVPRGDAVRPATDGMRQAVFSSLGDRVIGTRFLDLFAGSGAYGLEALSRGAVGGVFVEKSAKAVASLKRNIEAVCRSLGRGTEGLEILQADATKAPFARDGLPELIFIDPPYEIIADISGPLFARLGDVTSKQGERLVVFEMPGEMELNPPGWVCLKRLGKGARQPTVAFFRRAER